MHSVAVDNFKYAKFWLGNHGKFTLKDPFIAAVLGRLRFCSHSRIFKISLGFYAVALTFARRFFTPRHSLLASLRSHD